MAGYCTGLGAVGATGQRLGLEGSLNECELDLLRQRAAETWREKAKGGELIMVPPVGYVQGAAGVSEKDPDRRIQQAIRMGERNLQKSSYSDCPQRSCRIRYGLDFG